ncbi:hypothetical protein STEG23_017245, partial [Scotinomys teguina]
FNSFLKGNQKTDEHMKGHHRGFTCRILNWKTVNSHNPTSITTGLCSGEGSLQIKRSERHQLK